MNDIPNNNVTTSQQSIDQQPVEQQSVGNAPVGNVPGAQNAQAKKQPAPKKSHKGLIIAIVIAAVVLLVVGGIFVIKIISGVKEAMGTTLGTTGAPQATEAKIKDLSNYISVSGTVESQNAVKVTSKLTVPAKKVNVALGDYVKKGDTLVIFDDTTLVEQYQTVLATISNKDAYDAYQNALRYRNLREAQADKAEALAEAQKALDDARNARTRGYEAYNALKAQYDADVKALEQYATSTDAGYAELAEKVKAEKEQLDALYEGLPALDQAADTAEKTYKEVAKTANTAVEAAQDAIDAAKYNIDSETAKELQTIKDQLDACRVTAPRDGVITALNITEGGVLAADSLLTISDSANLKITVSIKEADILKISEGQKAIVKTIATGDTVFDGTVSRVIKIPSQSSAASLTGESSSSGYSADITIDSKNTDLLIGMTASGRIILESVEGVVSVPYSAIVEDEGETFVYKATKNSDSSYTISKVTVEKGLEGKYYTEIKSGDINEGDLVITAPEGVSEGKVLALSIDE